MDVLEQNESRERQNETEELEKGLSEIEGYADLTEGELVERAKELMRSDPESYLSLRERLESIKQNFYRKIKQKNEALRKTFLEEGGALEDFSAPINPLEEELREVLSRYKEKRASEMLRIENEKRANLEEKQRILEGLKALLDSSDDYSKKVPQFQKLQQEWKEVGQVPASDVNVLWKTYQLYVENFYDGLKINNELRDYDFRKNLEKKTSLCEQAEQLAAESDVIAAFRKLQALHDEWREVGPVSKDVREEIWKRFHDASTVLNKRHHDYFDKLREQEGENLRKKTELCDQVEAIKTDELKSYKEWQSKSDEIVAIQALWKTIGFAPKKDNQAIYERFRAACDAFFSQKNLFFKSTKEQLSANLAKKIALCEQAEALKDSTDWKATADKLVKLQKEWKTVGTVSQKHSEAVWKRFVAACDYFFEKKDENFKSQRSEPDSNLKRKKELVAQIQALEVSIEHKEESFAALKGLIAEWNEVGHVPFKEKDKIYDAYKKAIDEKFEKLDMEQDARRMDVFKANVQDMAEKGQSKLLGERKRLLRQYDALTADIANYENNIGFFSKSNKSNSLLKDMESKIQKLKKERDLLVEKIKMLEDAVK